MVVKKCDVPFCNVEREANFNTLYRFSEQFGKKQEDIETT
jgi:hypothetical protein